jgi:hypothetical protein
MGEKPTGVTQEGEGAPDTGGSEGDPGSEPAAYKKTPGVSTSPSTSA